MSEVMSPQAPTNSRKRPPTGPGSTSLGPGPTPTPTAPPRPGRVVPRALLLGFLLRLRLGCLLLLLLLLLLVLRLCRGASPTALLGRALSLRLGWPLRDLKPGQIQRR